MKENNIKHIIILIFLLTVSNFSQTLDEVEYPSSLIFAEGGGPGLMSINVEKYLSKEIGIRGGIGYGMIPFYFNYYKGEEKQLELGIGLVYSRYAILKSIVGKDKSILIGITIGHKYQPKRGGLTLRFSFTPLINPFSGESSSGIQLLAGISIGIAFR